MKNKITIELNRNQLSKLMDYFYACEEVAQGVDEQPAWTNRLSNYHDKILKALNDDE
jgi:hypothetical protein